MNVYVVTDTMGAGRIVGVFSDKRRADEVVGEFSHYYRIDRCQLDRIDPVAVDWARNEAQREWLQKQLKR